MNKVEEVEKLLIKYGSITSLEIMQTVYSMCPHSIIRDLREKYGADAITDEWQTKTRVKGYTDKGKELKETIRYKKYIWRGNAV